MDLLRILVSGTTDNMLPERDAITRAIMSLRISATRAEIEYSDELSPREEVLRRVYACGIYLGVYDSARYGRILSPDDLAVTELEFDQAQQLQKPTLIFSKKSQEVEPIDDRQEAFLGRVLHFATGKFGVSEFDDPFQLENLLADTLQELLVSQFHLQVTRPPFQAPRRLETFVGREDVLPQVARALTPGKPVVLYGLSDVGGLGKTELAICVAHQLRDRFPDGVLWANIRTTRPVDALINWVREFGGPTILKRGDLRFVFRPLSSEDRRLAELDARVDVVREQLRGKRVLAILDGAMDERDNERIAPLVSALQDGVVIVTSRTTRLYALESATPLEVPRLSEDEAWDLITQIVAYERIVDERVNLASIGRAVDFLPLALDLAARQLREKEDWTLETLAKILENERQRLETLRWGYSTARGLQTALNVSYHHLTADEKKFFNLLGAFAGDDFDESAAASITEETQETTRQRLDRLTQLALLQTRRRRGRYALHPVLRTFVRDKWEDYSPDRQMAMYYCALAQETGKKLETPEVHRALATLDMELSNILAGHAWAQSRNDRTGWELCRDYAYGAMTYYFNLKAMWSDWIAWSTLGIEAAQKLGDEHGASSIAGSLGMVYYRQKEFDQAAEFFKAALAIMEKMGYLPGIATIQMHLGNVQTEKGAWKDAVESHSKSLQIRERLGDMHGLAQSRANLGMLYAKYGDKAKARANWLQALEMFDHLGAKREADIVRQWLKTVTPSTYR